jgi:hypothetical protein
VRDRAARNRFERRPVATLLALAALAVALAEVALRLADPGPFRFVHQARQVHAYSERWYVDLVPERTAHLWLRDRSGGNVFNFLLTTNRHGFRSFDRPRDSSVDDLEQPAGRAGVTLVHALGDSYTMGWGVDYTSSYPALLDFLLPPEYRVLNLGADGYGTIAATEKSMQLAERFPPQHAIYLFSPNDFEDDARAVATAQRSRAVHALFRGLDGLRRHSYLANLPFVLRLERQFGAALSPDAGARGKTLAADRADPAALLLDSGPMPDPAAEANPSLAQIERYARFLQARGARLSVLVLSRQPASLAFYAFCRKLGLDVQLIEMPEAMRLRGDGHFNLVGNYSLARLLREKLLAGTPAPGAEAGPR